MIWNLKSLFFLNPKTKLLDQEFMSPPFQIMNVYIFLFFLQKSLYFSADSKISMQP